jgi:hypothetical protein
VEGIADLRLAPDRYLSLEADRAKARQLAALDGPHTALDLARAYYAMTADVDVARRARYLTHLAHAEERGAALAALLPARGRILGTHRARPLGRGPRYRASMAGRGAAAAGGLWGKRAARCGLSSSHPVAKRQL